MCGGLFPRLTWDFCSYVEPTRPTLGAAWRGEAASHLPGPDIRQTGQADGPTHNYKEWPRDPTMQSVSFDGERESFQDEAPRRGKHQQLAKLPASKTWHGSLDSLEPNSPVITKESFYNVSVCLHWLQDVQPQA